LLPRLLLNELSIIDDLLAGLPQLKDGRSIARDPVCGIVLHEGAAACNATVDGRTVAFCSEACRTRLLENPRRYL
jgi:YHS domain-containing protein